MNPHCLPSKIPLDAGAEAKTLPSEASQPYEAAIFACFERYRLELNDEPMVIEMEREARKLASNYFNRWVDVPNRGPFEARFGEQAIKFGLVYHAFSRIETEQRSAGTYGVKELEELPALGLQAMEAGLGISEWFAKCQDEYLAKKREEDKENVYYRFYQRFSKFPHFSSRDLYSASLGVQTAAAARKYFRDWEDRGLLEQIKSEQSGGAGRRKLPRYRFTTIVRGKFA